MPNGVEAVVDQALATARERAGRDAVASGLVAALARLRAAVDESLGYTVMSRMDATVRDIVIAHNLDVLARTGRVPEPVALPRPPEESFARIVLEDAAATCFALDAFTPGHSALHTAVWVLADRLLSELGGAPAIGALLDALRGAPPGGARALPASVSDAGLH